MNKHIDRIKEEYLRRDAQTPYWDYKKNIYHPRHPVGRLFHAHNTELLVNVLNTLDINLPGLKVLDVGCGMGGWLRRFVELGSSPSDLVGVDISPDRLIKAKELNPAIRWQIVSGDELPFEKEAFDIVLQSVVFSSIPDLWIRQKLAFEMQRVSKPFGYIFWLDIVRSRSHNLFCINQKSLADLFPDYNVVFCCPAHPLIFRVFNGYSESLSVIMSRMRLTPFESSFLILKRKA